MTSVLSKNFLTQEIVKAYTMIGNEEKTVNGPQGCHYDAGRLSSSTRS